jgi:non-homologous end joining protein Ku
MAPRAYWKGSLKLSLVTCPIALFPASTQAEKTHFHQINIQSGHRLRQQMVDEQTGRVVDTENKGRGYELSKGKYVAIEDEELDALRLESTIPSRSTSSFPLRRSTSGISTSRITSFRTARLVSMRLSSFATR